MNSLTSLLVGIDFSPCCRAALREALRLARWNRAALHAAHVIDELIALDLEEALARFQGNIRDALVHDAHAAWTTFTAAIEGAAQVALDVRIGHRVTGLLAAAQEAKADLLVLGASSAGDSCPGLGTVAAGCVRRAETSVLLVREDHAGAFRRIVACVDFSPASLRALDQAARVAAQDGAALHVLHVFTPPWRKLHYRAPTPEADPQLAQSYRDALERRLAAFAAELGSETDYLKPAYALFENRGHRSGIVEYAREVAADLLVLATRGRSNLRDLLLGSTAEKALQESTCSVLAVRAEEPPPAPAADVEASLAAPRPAF